MPAPGASASVLISKSYNQPRKVTVTKSNSFAKNRPEKACRNYTVGKISNFDGKRTYFLEITPLFLWGAYLNRRVFNIP
jgi:hypothetical protein